MFRNTHFSLAVHILASLAIMDGKPLPSSTIADSVNTNASFLRQLLGKLREASFLETKPGKGGGAIIAKPPDEITLWEVYLATSPETMLCTHRGTPGDHCVVGRNILPALQNVGTRIQGAVRHELESTTIADVVQDILDIDKH